jgi:hypothetical protein
MADEATELERCFVRYNAAKATLERATAHRKQVFTHHSPAWYAAVEARPTGGNWSLRMPAPGETAAAPA